MDIRYDIGDIIEYGPFGGGTRRVVVDTKENNIKNGRPGFAGQLVDSAEGSFGVWGYDDQIIRVVRRA